MILIADSGKKYGFAHLSSFDVGSGTRVPAGMGIAKTGASGTRPNGKGYGAHLHLTVTDANGKKINPELAKIITGKGFKFDNTVGSANEKAQREAERLEAERQRQLLQDEKDRQSIRMRYMDEEQRLTFEHKQNLAEIERLFGKDSEEQIAEEARYRSEMHELRMRDAVEFLRIQEQIASIRIGIAQGLYSAAQSVTDSIARGTMSASDYAMFSLGSQEDNARASANATFEGRKSEISEVEDAAQRNALLQEAKLEHETAMYAIDLEYAERRKELERDVTDNKIAMYQSATSSMLGLMQGFFGESKNLQRLAWAAEKGFTLARILIKEKEALMEAWRSAPFPYNMGMVASTAVQTGALAAAASAITPKGFKTGGYTGNLGVNTVAGVVHGNEYVFDAQATKAIGVDNLERIRKGKGTGELNVQVNNYSNATVDTQKDSDGNLVLTIRDEVKRSWSNLQNPNSHESKMLGRNVQAPRRR